MGFLLFPFFKNKKSIKINIIHHISKPLKHVMKWQKQFSIHFCSKDAWPVIHYPAFQHRNIKKFKFFLEFWVRYIFCVRKVFKVGERWSPIIYPLNFPIILSNIHKSLSLKSRVTLIKINSNFKRFWISWNVIFGLSNSSYSTPFTNIVHNSKLEYCYKLT